MLGSKERLQGNEKAGSEGDWKLLLPYSNVHSSACTLAQVMNRALTQAICDLFPQQEYTEGSPAYWMAEDAQKAAVAWEWFAHRSLILCSARVWLERCVVMPLLLLCVWTESGWLRIPCMRDQCNPEEQESPVRMERFARLLQAMRDYCGSRIPPSEAAQNGKKPQLAPSDAASILESLLHTSAATSALSTAQLFDPPMFLCLRHHVAISTSPSIDISCPLSGRALTAFHSSVADLGSPSFYTNHGTKPHLHEGLAHNEWLR